MSTPTADSLPVNFAQFLVSLGSSALVHLGEVTAPGAPAGTPDLEMATHTLALLRLLKAKTAGNLDADEARLLDALIAEVGPKVDAARARA
jgi:hypothetical protein